MGKQPKCFEIIPHTADAGIRAYGKTLEEAFANAAYGMFALMADLEGLAPKITKEIELTGENIEELFLKWLKELLYLYEVEHLLFTDFQVVALKKNQLKAIASGVKIDEKIALRLGSPVKAVTYHNLKIKHTNGWEISVIFDM